MYKKVCHITSTHNRYDVRILNKQCMSLVKNGYDVTLIVNDDKPNEIRDGVKIISTGYTTKNRINKFVKSSNYLLKKAKEVNASIYHFHDPDLLVLGNKLKKLGYKVIFDFHEDVPEQIKEKQWIPRIMRNITAKIYEVYENYSVKNYDALISVTPHIVKRLKKKNKHTYMITNYPIIEIKNSKDLKWDNNAICFAGGISDQWNHIQIINAISKIENIKYNLAGSGSQSYLEKLQNLLGWQKVDYKGKISHSEVKELYAESTIGIALNSSAQISGEGTLGNTKLFEFMAAGLPVICSNNRIWAEIIETHKCGIAINPSKEKEIVDAINHLINNPTIAAEMAKKGKEAVCKIYNWNTQEEVLLDLYKSI